MGVLDSFLSRLSESLVIDSKLCSRVRHKKSSCTACMDVCRSDAVSFTRAGGKIVIDWEKCTSCGECISACKTGVFSLKLSDKNRIFSALKAGISEDGNAVFACKNRSGDTTAGIPTMSFSDRKLFLKAAIMGADRIVLQTDNCGECTHKDCPPSLHRETEAAKLIFASAYENIEIVTEPFKPQKKIKNRLKASQDAAVMNRREFFGFLGTQTKKSVGQVVHSLSENDSNRKKTILTTDKDSAKRSFAHDLRLFGGQKLIDSLREKGALPSVNIDTEKCTKCGICARMCAFGVYSLQQETVKGRKITTAIEINQDNCTGCGICTLSCMAKAVNVTHCIV